MWVKCATLKLGGFCDPWCARCRRKGDMVYRSEQFGVLRRFRTSKPRRLPCSMLKHNTSDRIQVLSADCPLEELVPSTIVIWDAGMGTNLPRQTCEGLLAAPGNLYDNRYIRFASDHNVPQIAFVVLPQEGQTGIWILDRICKHFSAIWSFVWRIAEHWIYSHFSLIHLKYRS
jgi:hypothetical protein